MSRESEQPFHESDIAAHVQSLDPGEPEFAHVLGAMAEKAAALRKETGRVPYEVFIASLQLLGVYPCIEVLVTDDKGNLYLKRRSVDQNVSVAEAAAWGGKLHIPGTTVFPAKRFEMNYYSLLDNEVVGGEDGNERSINIASLYRHSETAGVSLYPEPERGTDALTVIMKIVVDPSILQDGYEQVTEENLGEVIEQHRPTIEKLLRQHQNGGPLLFDSR